MLELQTKTGNKYVWDEKTCLFILLPETLKAIKEVLKNKGLISEEKMISELNYDFEEKEIILCYNWIKKWEKLQLPESTPKNHYDISKTEAKEYILKNGLKSILLNVTEDCNFRCTYCAFSGHYEYKRDHSDRYMEFKTAKKAIDYYLSLITEGMKYTPLRDPVIGFYGGEPLLNFKLIKKCVNYIKKNYEFNNLQYSITTNGSLLTENIAKWLIKHQFHLYVSLDGPEKEHNRCRVYKDGTGTFKDVMQNISMIMNMNYKKISLLPVYDIKSDLFKMEEFFSSTKIPQITFVSPVDDSNTSYYEQFTEEDYLDNSNQIKKAENYFLKNIENLNPKNNFFSHLFGESIRSDLCDTISLNKPDNMLKYTATCFPGYKIFVSTDGTFYLCERVSTSFPIGNVNEGLNYGKIVKMIQKYFDHMDKCNNCKIRTRCRFCFKDFETDQGFNFSSNICKEIETREIDALTKSLNIAEKHPVVIDQNTKYTNIKKYYGE